MIGLWIYQVGCQFVVKGMVQVGLVVFDVGVDFIGVIFGCFQNQVGIGQEWMCYGYYVCIVFGQNFFGYVWYIDVVGGYQGNIYFIFQVCCYFGKGVLGY